MADKTSGVPPEPGELTPRQREIVQRLLKGMQQPTGKKVRVPTVHTHDPKLTRREEIILQRMAERIVQRLLKEMQQPTGKEVRVPTVRSRRRGEAKEREMADKTSGQRLPGFFARRPQLIPALLAAGMLVAALGPWPYGYYTVLRWVVCVCAVVVGVVVLIQRRLWYVWRFGLIERRLWYVWPFGLIAILFNPLVPIHLTREIWRPIHLMSAGLFVLGAFPFQLLPAGDVVVISDPGDTSGPPDTTANADPYEQLTPRQREILRRLADGKEPTDPEES